MMGGGFATLLHLDAIVAAGDGGCSMPMESTGDVLLMVAGMMSPVQCLV